jgi:ADP-heptose:LPS heptosyltransferase
MSSSSGTATHTPVEGAPSTDVLIEAHSAPILEAARRILVCRVDEIGDVVLTTPFLRELRRNAPHAHITLVVKPAVASLVETSPYVDKVLTYNWLHRRVFIRPDRYTRVFEFWSQHLRHDSFDLALLPRRDHDHYSAKLLAFLSGARWRVGCEPTGPSEPILTRGGWPLLTHVVRDRTPRHEVVSTLNILRALGGRVETAQLELQLIPEDQRAVDEVVRATGATAPLIALSMGAGASRRKWPLDRFRALVLWIQHALPATVVVIGGPADAVDGARLAASFERGVVNLAGRFTLRQTAALLSRCRMFIGNDSGPMHLAVAAGTPVVEVTCHPSTGPLDHANSPARYGPWEVAAKVVRPRDHRWPCWHGCLARWPHCILGVSVPEVQAAVAELWTATDCA